MSRKRQRVWERRGVAPALPPLPAAAPVTVENLFAAAVALHRAGALVEAERHYRQVIALAPTHAEAHSRLGAAVIGRGKTAEAISHIERALALAPNLFEAHANLAQAYLQIGRSERAIESACRALELNETAQSRAVFVHCISSGRLAADNGLCRKWLLRALTEGWARPRALTAACIGLIKLDRSINDAIARADAAWPDRLSATELFGAAGLAPLAHHELLCRLLETDPITDLGLERLLTCVRSALLTGAAGGAADDDLLVLSCALARQCFLNEYVFSVAAAEAARAQRLRATLDHALAAQPQCPAHWVAMVGAYFPLHTLSHARALLDRSWPPCIEGLLVQQIKEPDEERRIAAGIAALTAIDGEVSRAVREQYEENPYPRWAKSGTAEWPVALGASEPSRSPDILVAGCGTGLSTIELAREARGARILAVDLSLRSLGYAKRIADELGFDRIEFAQADISRISSIARSFDFIDASGVLHHLADPWEGWRILLSLLRPGGGMQVGLYSELARTNIVAARALIAQRRYRPVIDDIRRCRDDIAASSDPLLKSVTLSEDFYSTSECRDLLFHVQEHRTNLPAIKSFLATNGVKLVGFLLDPATQRRFAARFPEPAAMTDLDRWHEFETDNPHTFGRMYAFSIRKT
jgi:SAM-dependent methyltransferase